MKTEFCNFCELFKNNQCLGSKCNYLDDTLVPENYPKEDIFVVGEYIYFTFKEEENELRHCAITDLNTEFLVNVMFFDLSIEDVELFHEKCKKAIPLQYGIFIDYLKDEYGEYFKD